MGAKGRFVWGLLMLALAVGAIGCGEDASTSAGSEEAAAEERIYPNIEGPTREFLIPGGNNAIQLFGEEATAAEREKATKVLQIWMKARVAEDWVTDCKHLSRDYVKTLLWDVGEVTGGRVKTCPGALEYFGDEASGTSGNTLSGLIDSLRIRDSETGNSEKEAFAQWHGPRGIDWVLPMTREGGAWKVSVAGPVLRAQ